MALEDSILISELPAGGRLQDADLFAIERGATNPSLLGSALQRRLWFPQLTGLTGGGTDKLDALATLAVSAGELVILYAASQLQFWRLQAGTTAEDGVDVVRPDDYAGGSNEKIWRRVL